LDAPLLGHTDRVQSLAFSPDGKTLASAAGGFDGTIILWDLAGRRPVGEPFVGHTTGVRQVLFSPDSTLLATTSDGSDGRPGRIILWDVASRLPLGQPLEGPSRILHSCMAFTPDGNTLVAGNWENGLILWDVSLDAWLARAGRVTNRNLSVEEWRLYVGEKPYCKTFPDLP
jgi:WD40 repeat protein